MSLRIGDAGTKGRGVFATGTFQPGDLVLDYQGEEKWIWDIPENLWQYTFQVDYDKYILPKEGSPGWYLNHSCEPNCVILGRTRLVSLSKIEPGEEVTFDYSTNVGWDGYAMECSCGSPRCRRIIRSYRYLDDGLRRGYGACVSSFLLRVRESASESTEQRKD